jgi:hypothetical protein
LVFAESPTTFVIPAEAGIHMRRTHGARNGHTADKALLALPASSGKLGTGARAIKPASLRGAQPCSGALFAALDCSASLAMT